MAVYTHTVGVSERAANFVWNKDKMAAVTRGMDEDDYAENGVGIAASVGMNRSSAVPGNLPKLCKETDQAAAALIKDLKQRGLLEDTLVVWGGEFGRTNYCQGKISPNFGRDHHPRCFSVWMAGGGTRPGTVYGETDEFGYNVVRDGVHIHDFHATMMHLLGIDHERLTYKFQGRRYRLTDVAGTLVKGLLA